MWSFCTVRQAAARAVKRVRKDSSDSDSERGFSSDSDFKLSPSEDSAAEISDESNASSDFNPFDDGSDSEGESIERIFVYLRDGRGCTLKLGRGGLYI